MNVHLTPELEQLVQSKVQSGRFHSASDVVHDEAREAGPRELRGQMDRALGESARGEGVDGEEFLQGMLDELDAEHGRKAG